MVAAGVSQTGTPAIQEMPNGIREEAITEREAAKPQSAAVKCIAAARSISDVAACPFTADIFTRSFKIITAVYFSILLYGATCGYFVKDRAYLR